MDSEYRDNRNNRKNENQGNARTCDEDGLDWKAGSRLFFENLEWLTTAEAAAYLRKFCPLGMPSVNAVHKLVSNGKIRRRKFAGRLFFKRKELDYLIECSEA